MIKSYIFASMYTVVGMTGWGAYSTIASEDTSVAALHNIAVSAMINKNETPLSKSLYRWKDHEGNWQYGEIKTTDVDMAQVEEELALLRSLPRAVLPTQSLTAKPKDVGFFAMIPSINGILKLVNLDEYFNNQSQPQTQAKTTNIMDETLKYKQLMENHNDELKNI